MAQHEPLSKVRAKTIIAGDGRFTDVTKEQESEIRKFAETFLGYGELDAPYWFIGTEPGLSRQQSFLDGLKVWVSVGRPLTICSRQHHLESGFGKWHRPDPPLQSTWRILMLALCVFLHEYENDAQSKAWRRSYQERRLGCAGGETAVLELGALNAAHRGDWPYVNLRDPDLNNRDRYVDTFLERRARELAILARERPRSFVWMYGARREYQRFWDIVGGKPWTEYQPLPGVTYRCEGGTLYVITDHVTYRRGNAYWVQFGEFLRNSTRADEGLTRFG